MNILRVLIVFSGLLLAFPCWPEPVMPPLTNPRVLPNPPRAGEPLVVRFNVNGCSSWVPGEEQVTIVGNVITFTHQVDWICGVSPPSYDYDFALGTFQPGTYTLVYAPTWSFGDPYLTQSIQFGVFAISIPASSWWAAVVLGLALLLFGSRHLTVHSSRRANARGSI